jgi:hypothetical protein
MAQSKKLSTAADAPASTDSVGNIADMGKPLHLPAVAAAWPAGVSQLAQAVDACQRSDSAAVSTDWLAHALSVLRTPPTFSSNADEF